MQRYRVLSFSVFELMLLASALLWGFGFVLQKYATYDSTALFYNGTRFLLGSIMILPVLYFFRPKPGQIKLSIYYGVPLGVVLFVASWLQQAGLFHTTTGNAGFISAFAVVLVPFFSMLWGYRPEFYDWVGAILALIGLYILSIGFGISIAINYGDGIVFGGSFFWAIHIFLMSFASVKSSPVLVSLIQAFVAGVLSLGLELIMTGGTLGYTPLGFKMAVYSAFIVVMLAYTLQVLAQRFVTPHHAAIILSVEAPTAMVLGIIIFAEPSGLNLIVGAILMLAGVLTIQLYKRR